MFHAFKNRLNCLKSNSHRPRKHKSRIGCRDSRRNRRLFFEAMEDRRLLSIIPSYEAILDLDLSGLVSESQEGILSGNPGWEDHGDSYWADGRQISLWRSNKEMVMRLSSESSAESLVSDLANAGGILADLQIEKTLDSRTLVLSLAIGNFGDSEDTTI